MKKRGANGEAEVSPGKSKRRKVNELEKQVVVSTIEGIKIEDSQSCDRRKKVATSNKARKPDLTCPVIIASCHKNAMKAVSLSPRGKLATCDLGGHIKFWQLKGTEGALVATHATSWTEDHPEDVAWHPRRKKLFIAYRPGKDSKDSEEPRQVAIASKKGHEFLQHSPHQKGTLRCIRFMPWKVSESDCFVTGADDHSVVLWSQENSQWHPKPLLRNLHSSSVYGVAGTADKSYVLSAGLDKQLIVYDVAHGQSYFSGKGSHPLLDVQMNPRDPSLVLLTASGPSTQQLSLHDMRQIDLGKPIHEFGWALKPKVTKQFHQCWSRDGLFVSSGSGENKFLVFDIRYKGNMAANVVTGHEGAVLKAEWHPKETNMVISVTRGGHIWLQDLAG